ncbi:MAG: D-lysine 5,6-aminomutase subunit alpha [Actinobacteria bacterium]|nr:D-lysine 5,6-aminomutase subunit alpha [Actinomycetota bacterium]
MGAPRLGLPADKIALARELASRIAAPVMEYVSRHTTVSIERATLRLLGADGADARGVPVPNLAVDSLRGRLENGAALYYVNALIAKGLTPGGLNRAIASGLDISTIELGDLERISREAHALLEAVFARIEANAALRRRREKEWEGKAKSPLLYLIVATGNIYEDVKQARAAARQGADAIAVIRATAQSLLDYVPHGATTEGIGGTYATQENFRIMREALDEVAEEEGRYIYLVNYSSGLCMPEIAVMGALERLDMLLNDSMYGILFRDINMYRTFADQHFSRMIIAAADMAINTGEDNYLTTSDAWEKACTVLASQFINERFALAAGLPHRLIGLGHAFEMNPGMKNGFLYELAQACMAREIFPDCPLKYMPPTKFMSGDIFMGYAMNTMFNLLSKVSGQSIHLLGMLTEAIHNPFLQDRYLALENAMYVMNNAADLGDEIAFREDGMIIRRALEVLNQAVSFLEEVDRLGLFEAIERGLFAEIKRPRLGGKGLEGVVRKSPAYWNPVLERMENRPAAKEGD